MLWSIILSKKSIKTRVVKQRLFRQLNTFSDSKKIKEAEQLITTLYKKNEAYTLSKQACKKRRVKSNDFIYGEVEFLSFFSILTKITPQSNDIFYDLGCGSGKAVLTAALCFNLTKACGVEFLPELHTLANKQVIKARQLASDSKRLDCIQLYNDDFLKCNFTEATILFINATCINEANWDALLKKIMLLQAGSRIILTSKKIQHEKFKVISTSKELMSWGMNSVNIYLKTS